MTGPDRQDQQRGDALRARLAGIDPTRPGGPAFATDLTPDHVQERIMATTDQPLSSEKQRTPDGGDVRHGTGRTRWLPAAAALVLAAAGLAGALALRSNDEATATPPAVALTVPGGDGAVTSSCVQFDVRFLRDMPIALAGTVTAVTDQQVTLTVDRWYHGTASQQHADMVTLAVPGPGTSAALDGVQFTRGGQYLIAATDGTVNGCGFSGPADRQLRAAYAEAFGG